ncbi:MAG: hypothetical protein KAJ48_03755, partial [Elusimicrobiales bacterium]|nr:hypothetical protein [Elusimicrobiales bacterium]
VNTVRLYLRKSNGYYWNGIDWQVDFKDFAADGVDPWTKLIDHEAAYIDGEEYTIETNAVDVATNEEGYGLKSTFVYDITPPTATISYPYDGAYISQTGKITGGSYDQPNGIVEKIYVRIEQLSGPHIGEFWSVEDMQWTSVGAPEVWNDILAYGTLSPDATWWQLNTAPWQTGETYEVNAYAKDKADNYEFVYSTVTNVAADFTAPTSTMTYPAHQETVSTDLTVITGSASDVDPGVLDKVQLSYKCVSDVCDTKYWNRASGAWDSVAEIFYDADITGNAWEATGASSPTWVTSTSGIDYEIFAKAVDQAQNEVTKPGAPALDSPYIKFTLETPGPISSINTPDTSIPHWRITALPSIAGTALYATTVQVRVTDFGVDLDELGGNDNLCWNGNAWESTTTFNTFVGVNSFAGGNWTFSLSQAQWNGNRRYRVESKAINETPEPDENEVPGVGEKFIIDSSAPVVSIINPDENYEMGISTLSGN